MNRRTVLQSAGVAAMMGLAGCVDAIKNHFTGNIQGPVPVEITNDGKRPYDIHIEAYARKTNRKTYKQSYTVTPRGRVSAPSLEGSDQRLKVTRFSTDDGAKKLVESGVITAKTQRVLITIHDDALTLDIMTDENGANKRENSNNATQNNTQGSNETTTKSRSNESA